MLFRSVCTNTRSWTGNLIFPAAIIGTVLFFIVQMCPAQTIAAASTTETRTVNGEPATAPPAAKKGPLTDKEREELYELIRNLQERVAKLEAGQAKTDPAKPPANTTASAAASPIPDQAVKDVTAPSNGDTDASASKPQKDDDKKWGIYTPNLGFKVADTQYGDMSISIYSYVRYLNQLGLDPTYTDAFGNTKDVQRRQDVQLLKLQIKFLGWVLDPKLRYFLYAWTSNANQGQGAQTVLAGNMQYSFNKHITVGGGIRSLPGTRSVEGNFPFWPSVDSRMIGDEFMRPSYTSGIWAMGNITDRLEYITMLGNNMSTLGVPAVRLDNGFNTWSNALIWYPTGNFKEGFSGQGWGDFEDHKKFSPRIGFHFTRSDENKESQPTSETFENTQLRLSDGTVIFTPDLFAPGVTVTDARYRMMSLDAAFKYKGFSLEGEYFWRWIDNFKFLAQPQPTTVIPNLFDHSIQIQGTAMLKPRTIQAYSGFSRIFGQYGDPWDFRSGINYFPYKNKVLRWNNEVLYLNRSPVGYTSVPYPVGGRGWVFHSSVELAF